MDPISNEVQRAADALGFASHRVRPLPSAEAGRVYDLALRHFVPTGRPRWWWEHFPRSTSVHFRDGDGPRCLRDIVPNPDETVWLIAEDHADPGFSVWEGTVTDLQAVIAECFSFEYYVISRDLRWLICENHHDVVIAVGSDVEARLSKYRVA